MTAKETTLNELGEMLGYVVENMATKDDIANMATKDDIVNMATKDDIMSLKAELKGDIASIMEELADIKLRLKAIEPMVEDHSGHAKEIDHALERIAAIEKHLGIKHKATA